MRDRKQLPQQTALIYAVAQIELLELLEAFLSEAGLELRKFTDAGVAFAEFTSARPRPVLLIAGCLDLQGSGLELMRQCKELEPKLMLVLWSGMPEAFIDELLAKARVTPDARFPKGAGSDFLKLCDEIVTLATPKFCSRKAIRSPEVLDIKMVG
jgi:hypothetical protein